MATRQLSVKFDTEGFQAAINQMQAIGKAFDVVLANAQNNIKIAKAEIAAAGNNGSIDQLREAQKLLEQNIKIANRAIAASYRELGIKSSESLNNLRAQAVSAFEAIKISGTASVADIARAQDALNSKLKQLENQLNSQNVNAYKVLGIQSRADLEEARQQIMEAYRTLKQGSDGSRQSQQELGLAYRSMVDQVNAINKQLNQSVASNDLDAAYKLLGVRSKTDLEAAEYRIIKAYETIRDAKKLGSQDEVAARKAMESQVNAINGVSDAYKALGMRSREQLLAAKTELDAAWTTLSTKIKITGQDLAVAYEKYLSKVKEIDQELNRSASQQKLNNAYQVLGVRSESELKKARDEIVKSYEMIRNAAKPGSRDDVAALAAMQSRVGAIDSELGIKDPAKQLGDAYRALGFRSEAEIKKAIKEITDAYDLIRNSGVKSQRDIELAASSLQQKLKQLASELLSVQNRDSQNAYRLLGIRSDAELVQAQQDIIKAFELIETSGVASANDIRRAYEAMQAKLKQLDAEMTKTVKPKQAAGDAYKLLGIRSEAELIKARNDIVTAFNDIQQAGSRRDISIAQNALIAKLKQLDAELQGTTVRTNIFKTSIENLSSAFTSQLTFAISGTLLQLPNSIGAAVSAYARFEDQISALKAVSGGTKEEIGSVRTEIERLGTTTSKTPEDIAKLSVELARAGYSAGEIVSALNGIVKASEAAGEDLTRVGTIISGVLKAYGLPASESGRIADLLTQTANKAAVSVSDLGESLKYVGTTAAGSNQQVEDVLVVLGLMGNVMLKSGQAGRNYAQTLDKMKLSSAGASDELIVSSRGIEQAGEAMKRLGVNFRDADGQMRPFLDILPELKEKMKSLPQQDQDVISRVLFGVEGGRAVQTTLRATGKDIDYLVTSLKDADGVADRTSKIMNEGLGGSFRTLSASAQVLSNRMVQEFSPAIKSAVDTISSGIKELSNNTSTLIGIFGGLAISGITGLVISAFKALSAAAAALSIQIQAAGGASAFFKTSLTALLTPTNLAVAAIGILAGTLIKFSTDARQARAEALALGSSLDILATKKERTALIELEEKERNAQDQLRELKQRSSAITSEMGYRAGFGVPSIRMPWDANRDLFIKPTTELQQESKKIDAEIQDLEDSIKRIPQVRRQIKDNLSRKDKPNDFADRTPSVGAPIPPSIPKEKKGGSTGSGKKGDRSSDRSKDQEYYEFPVARPTPGPVTSGYGMRTLRGITRMHDGIDYAPPAGTPIIAPLPGRVTRVDYEKGGAGHYVTIESIDKAGKKIEQTFMHMIDRALVGVGESVKQGDILGRVGSTGRSTGPHLHWRTRINGQSINPAEFLKMQFSLPSGTGKPSDYLRSQDAAAQKSDQSPLIQEVLAMSKRLGINPMDILRVMLFETGGTLSPKKHKSGAVGLIGFTKDNEGELKVSLSDLAKMSAVQQIPYVEKYLQIHSGGQKLDSFQKVASTVFHGNPKGSLSVSDGNITLGEYLKVADLRYGEKARTLIGQNDKELGETIERGVEFRDQKQDIRQDKIKTTSADIKRKTEDEKYILQQEHEQKIHDLKIQSLTADEISRNYIEQEIKLQEILFNDKIQKLELTEKQQQVEQEISILEKDKTELSTTELDRLKELYDERKRITNEIQLANKQSERAIALHQLESEQNKKAAIDKLRSDLEGILQKVIPTENLTEIEKELNNVISSTLKEREELNKKLTEANKLGDTVSLDKITNALGQLDKELPKFLGSQLRQLNKTIGTPIPSSELDTYREDEVKRKEALVALEIKYRDLRIGAEALLTAARKTANQELIAGYEKLLALINKTHQAEVKQVQDQGNILKNVITTAKKAFASGLGQFFTDLINGTKSLEDSFKSFAGSILKAIADMAIQAASKQVIKFLFGSSFQFADGGYVSGPGTGRSDSIPARLSNGEFVMSASSVRHWGVGLLENLNDRKMPQLAFQSPSYNNGSSRSGTIIMNVNTPDANSFRRSETQMGKDAAEQLRRGLNRNG